MKKIFLCVMVLFACLVSGCSCVHTHIYNDYGVCICNHDISQTLNYANGEYTSLTNNVETNTFYYYKFTAHGEESIDFILESDEVRFDRIEIRAEGMLQTIAMRVDDAQKLYRYSERSVNNNKVYYLKIRYWNDGPIKLVIKPTE